MKKLKALRYNNLFAIRLYRGNTLIWETYTRIRTSGTINIILSIFGGLRNIETLKTLCLIDIRLKSSALGRCISAINGFVYMNEKLTSEVCCIAYGAVCGGAFIKASLYSLNELHIAESVHSGIKEMSLLRSGVFSHPSDCADIFGVIAIADMKTAVLSNSCNIEYTAGVIYLNNISCICSGVSRDTVYSYAIGYSSFKGEVSPRNIGLKHRAMDMRIAAKVSAHGKIAGTVNSLAESNTAMRMTGGVFARDKIWEEPILTDNSLYIRQAYQAVQNERKLEVT